MQSAGAGERRKIARAPRTGALDDDRDDKVATSSDTQRVEST